MDMNQGKQYTKLVQTKHQSKLQYSVQPMKIRNKKILMQFQLQG